jgi:hypothetical protein
MSLSRIFYGEVNPSREKKALIIYLTFCMASAFYGMYADFVPSDTWKEIGFISSSVISVPITFLTWWSYGTGRINFKYGISLAAKIFASLVMPLIMYGFLYVGVIHGIGAISVMALGEKTSVTMEFTKEKRNSRKSCDYRLKNPEMKNAFPAYLCTNEEFYKQGNKKVSLIVTGYKSKMGLYIASYNEKR